MENISVKNEFYQLPAVVMGRSAGHSSSHERACSTCGLCSSIIKSPPLINYVPCSEHYLFLVVTLCQVPLIFDLIPT